MSCTRHNVLLLHGDYRNNVFILYLCFLYKHSMFQNFSKRSARNCQSMTAAWAPSTVRPHRWATAAAVSVLKPTNLSQ